MLYKNNLIIYALQLCFEYGIAYLYMFGYIEKSSAVINTVSSPHIISYGYTRKGVTDTAKISVGIIYTPVLVFFGQYLKKSF